MTLISRPKNYTEKDFISAKEMARITGYAAREFTDPVRRAEFDFDFTVIRLKDKGNRVLFIRSEFNKFLHQKVEEAKKEKRRLKVNG